MSILEPAVFISSLSQGSGEMTEVEPVLDFASSGRSGRRNALPDILGSPAGVSPSDLPLKLAELSLTGLGGSLTHSQSIMHNELDFHVLNCVSVSADGPGGAQSPSSQDVPPPADGSDENQRS